MRPILLTMEAFGSYGAKTTIDFSKASQNLFLITGDTGAGKSTIFDAIVFALYGEASSMNNKKDGRELQSQFTAFDVEPYVELTFSEGGELYTVRRSPRHVRANKKTPQREKVSLIMPDGTEYSSTESNNKLIEIVGLTKGQFMQIAMIAQGEFIDVIRAKTPKKKEIFRKLFNTEMYQKIVDELYRRKKEKEAENAKFKTKCQNEVGHIEIPSDYVDSKKLEELKNSILSNEKYSIAGLEELIVMFETLCKWCEEQKDIAEKKEKESNEAFQKKATEYTKAEEILKQYEILESATLALKECGDQAADVDSKVKLVERIQNAYEIKGAFEYYNDREMHLKTKQQELAKRNSELPTLVNDYSDKEKTKLINDKIKDTASEKYSKVSEKVKASLESFDKIAENESKLGLLDKQLQAAVTEECEAKQKLDDLIASELIWKKQAKELEGVEVDYVRVSNQNNKLSEIRLRLVLLEKNNKSIADDKLKISKLQDQYRLLHKNYEDKKTEYDNARRLYLANCAGMLASQLEEGDACPVCGSTHHPNKCSIGEATNILSAEELEVLASEVEIEETKERDKATEINVALNTVSEAEKRFTDDMLKLVQDLEIAINDKLPANITISDAKLRVDSEISICNTQLSELRSKCDKLRTLNNNLAGVDDAKNKLMDELENRKNNKLKLQNDRTNCVQAISTRKESLAYESKASAVNELEMARKDNEAATIKFNESNSAFLQAKSNKEKCDNDIASLNREIPQIEQERNERLDKYNALMTDKAMDDQEWLLVISTYSSDTSLIKEEIDGYRLKKNKNEALKASALSIIGNTSKPDLSILLIERNLAEEQKNTDSRIAESYRKDNDINNGVLANIKSLIQGREKVLAEYSKLESLYSRLNGNVTGGRMDIETYAQRCYLEQILDAANERFYEMSLGQFELRMYELEQAGDGANRGLDLMVYSHVTGKERDVKMLSGGESFIAALALALGMADQIQEKSAAINLDIMFIDEGFGSLDDASRKEAIKMLKKMAGGTKLIGLISHVSELKQEIEDHLLVKKTDKGSVANWEV